MADNNVCLILICDDCLLVLDIDGCLHMLNFTVGPVMESGDILAVGGEQVPYFRTAEFSEIMLQNEKMILELADAPSLSRAVFLTGSGTAAMESAVMNLLSEKDNALIVNGGSFGHRFVELCELHQVPYDQIVLDSGKALTEEDLNRFDGSKYSSFIVNLHETSTGVLYDLDLISEFCNKNNLFLIVDAISAFLADPISMRKANVGAMIIGSQKALACHPGVSAVLLAPTGLDRVNETNSKCMYLDLKNALKNGERGQTPFTPAVSVLRQINARLSQIMEQGGIVSSISAVKAIADDFRSRIAELPFVISSNSLSNAVTPLHPLNASAYDVFLHLKDEYGIWVCPNGGDLADKVFRVGHIGALTIEDNAKLVEALLDLKARGLL